MRKLAFIGTGIFGLILLDVAFGVGPQRESRAMAAPDLAPLALQRAAVALNAEPSSLVIVGQAVATYPLQGKSATRFKVLEPATHDVTAVDLLADGTLANAAFLRATEQQLWQARFGKFSPDLAAVLATASDSASFDITISLAQGQAADAAKTEPR